MTHDPDILEAGEVGNIVSFHWNVIDKCQFNCTYCYATDFNKNDFFTKNKYHESYRFVLYKLQHMDFDFEVDLLGGEPTLHPHLPEIVGALEALPHCKRINLYTNFTAKLKYYKQFDVKHSKLTLCLSYHAEYHKRIFKKYLALRSITNNMKMFVEVNLYPKREYFNQIQTLIHNLKEHDIRFGVNTVRENKYWDNTVDEGFEEIFNTYLQDTMINPLARSVRHKTNKGVEFLNENYVIQNNISYYGYTCEALMYSIDINGDIFNTCSGEKVRLTDTSFVKPIICPNKNTCPCPDMLYYRKVK